MVDAVRAIGKRIIAWGKVEDDAVIDRLIDLSVDGIGSNRPDRVILRLKSSGREGWA